MDWSPFFAAIYASIPVARGFARVSGAGSVATKARSVCVTNALAIVLLPVHALVVAVYRLYHQKLSFQGSNVRR